MHIFGRCRCQTIKSLSWIHSWQIPICKHVLATCRTMTFHCLPHQIPILSLALLLVWLFSPTGYLKNLKIRSFLNAECLKFRSHGVVLAHQSMLRISHPHWLQRKIMGRTKSERKVRSTIWTCVVVSEYITLNICEPGAGAKWCTRSFRGFLSRIPAKITWESALSSADNTRPACSPIPMNYNPLNEQWCVDCVSLLRNFNTSET